ncbi:MAG: hypothetical protein WCI92_12035 [Bacteroidota bacterium]
MKTIAKFLTSLGLFVTLILIAGCTKDTTDPVVSQPVISATYSRGAVTVGVTQWVTLNWDSKNADSCFLNGEYLPLLKGSKDVDLVKETTIFTFTATNKAGKTTTKVEVKKLAPPIVTLTATVTNLPKGGGKTKITLNATKTNEVSFNGCGYTTFPVSFETAWLSHDSTFTFIATGDGGETVAIIKITVVPPTEQELMLSQSWVQTKEEDTYFITGPWKDRNFDFTIPCVNDDIMAFYMTPQKILFDNKILCDGGNDLPSWVPWLLNSDGTLVGIYPQRTIINLNWNTLVWIYESTEYNDITGVTTKIYVKSTYVVRKS